MTGASLAPAARPSGHPRAVTLIGNCQMTALGRCMQTMREGVQATTHLVGDAWLRAFEAQQFDEELAASDLIFVHAHHRIEPVFSARLAHLADRVRRVPSIVFSAFHPDLDYVFGPDSTVKGPMGEYHSALVFHAWRQGWSEAQALALFREEVFRELGYLDQWTASANWLAQEGLNFGIPMGPMIERWTRRGPWMHSINHPHSHVLADLAQALLVREGLPVNTAMVELLPDSLAEGPVWPIYPEVARQFAVEGHYRFKLPYSWSAPQAAKRRWQWPGRSAPRRAPAPLLQFVGLEEFIAGSYRSYASFDRSALRCARLEAAPWRDWLQPEQGLFRTQAPTPSNPTPAVSALHPYRDLPDHHFWRRAIERTPAQDVDPVAPARQRIGPEHRVATAGSCFAQHIAHTLQRSGLQYFVTELGDSLAADEAARRQYGVYSARYGNLYTARQLLQLFDRAYGHFAPQESAWQRADGRWVDPFRPEIEPDGFGSPEEVAAAREPHFAAVRQMFESLDVFVFTFGLTEAWCNQTDGAVFPLAPGVAGGAPDPQVHSLHHFSVAEVVGDFRAFLQRLHEVNPSARVVLSVSPVAMMATYAARHVLVSNTHTKAVLCAAAHEICAQEASCEYFPGYEMMMGAHTRGAYIADDLRTIRPEGVAHVMHAFMRHFTSLDAGPRPALPAHLFRFASGTAIDAESARRHAQWREIVCEEESLDVPR